MSREPLVPFFKGDRRVFYKYPMSVFPYLVLPRGFKLYWEDTPEVKSLRNVECLNRPERKWFEMERKRWLAGIQSDANSQFDKLVKGILREQSDHETLRTIIAEHGLFNYSFFRRKVWGRVASRFGVKVNEVRRLVMKLPQRNPNWQQRGKFIETEFNAISEIFEHLYEQTLMEVISGKKTYALLEKWFDDHSHFKKCELCGDYFRVIDIPRDYYYGSNACNNCCFGRLVVERPSKKKLKELIPAFVTACGFIPTAEIGPTKHDFTSRISSNDKINVFRAYAFMGGIDHVKNIFGNWFQALVKTNTLPDGVLRTTRGIKCLAKDGHMCLSLDEQFIDNWLYAHSISHEREPFYPSHPQLNANGKRRADWKVGNTLIEYFGLMGDDKYERRMTEKMLLAEKLDIKVIPIYPSDLSNLVEKLSDLL
jgi:hypothetical protein